jgi:hypothetical protein
MSDTRLNEEWPPERIAALLAADSRWQYEGGGRKEKELLFEEIIRTAQGKWRERALKAEAEVESLINERSIVSDSAFEIMSNRVTVRFDVEVQRQLDAARLESTVAEFKLAEAYRTIGELRETIASIRSALGEKVPR